MSHHEQWPSSARREGHDFAEDVADARERACVHGHELQLKCAPEMCPTA